MAAGIRSDHPSLCHFRNDHHNDCLGNPAEKIKAATRKSYSPGRIREHQSERRAGGFCRGHENIGKK
jgi:hypothetical protein